MAEIADYKQTQHVALLIDMDPVFYLTDPNPFYFKTLLSAIKTLLSFPPLSSTLFSFRFFCSSLSPLLSSSKLPHSSFSLSFDYADSVFNSLSSILSSFSPSQDVAAVPKASHVVFSLWNLIRDYQWDADLGMDSVVKSNLVVVFSPMVRVLNSVKEFLDLEDDKCLKCFGGFNEKFRGFFKDVKDVFLTKDIHVSWIDVRFETGCDFDECNSSLLGFFERGIRHLGWGFCSSDSILLGSSLVPFGLIYPQLAVSLKCLGFDDKSRKIQTQFCLEIKDVSGNPLEHKCCDLELVDLDVVSEVSDFVRQKMLWEGFKDGVVKLHVKAVRKYDVYQRMRRMGVSPFSAVLVRELLRETKKDCEDNSGELFEDRVVKILGQDLGGSVMRRSISLWQVFISFLCREDYWAFVSLSNGNGSSLVGVLKPFTISTALLSFVGDEFQRGCRIEEFDQVDSSQKDTSATSPATDTKQFSELIGSEIHSKKRKRDKKDLDKIKEITWSDFCKAALEHHQINLEDIYFARCCTKSKILKFMKCWMKQIKISSFTSSSVPNRCTPIESDKKEEECGVTNHESEQPTTPCASAGAEAITDASGVQDEIAIDFRSETMESFFNDLPHKVRRGLESEDVDLQLLAERLVSSSIYWLHKNFETKNASKSQTSVQNSNSGVAVELTKLLLKEPKDLAATFKSSDSSFQGNYVNREYELQILFRMEILRSEVGASVEESTKHRFVKQICSFLDTIQCQLQDGFFGDWNLDRYVRKLLKSRYHDTLDDVVHKIYVKMDLLLFNDEEESMNSLLNSEDNSHSKRENLNGDDMEEHYRPSDVVLAECSSASAVNLSAQRTNREEHIRKLNEAKEKRQMARRRASFTTWTPDLMRVWAPKADPLPKSSKRRGERRGSDDVVQATPMTENKHFCQVICSSSDEYKVDGTSPSGSVSKALFQVD